MSKEKENKKDVRTEQLRQAPGKEKVKNIFQNLWASPILESTLYMLTIYDKPDKQLFLCSFYS